MRMFKLMAIVAALALALAGCELDEEGADGGGTGGNDVAQGADVPENLCPEPRACTGEGTVVSNFDLQGDDNCEKAAFYDVDCANLGNDQFTFTCGKDACDYTDGICESMLPCGAVFCFDATLVGKPCPNDPDCFGTDCEPAMACEADGHCDTWCPNDSTGGSIDPDCNGVGGEYCAGGAKAGQCD